MLAAAQSLSGMLVQKWRGTNLAILEPPERKRPSVPVFSHAPLVAQGHDAQVVRYSVNTARDAAKRPLTYTQARIHSCRKEFDAF